MSSPFPYISRKQATKFAQGIKDGIYQPLEHSLLHYAYGIGGIGKTTLLRKIEQEYATEFQCVWISFDEAENESASVESPIELMKTIDQKISGGIFAGKSSFQKKLENYDKTILELETQPIEGEEQVSEEQIEQVRKLVRGGAKAIGVIAAANTDGGVASASVINPIMQGAADLAVNTGVAGKQIYDFFKKHKATKNKPELQELVENPLPQLTKAIIDTLIKKSAEKPILIFIDTYEKASSEFDNFLCRFLLSDKQLQESPVRIVMAGRYSLSNKRYKRLFQRHDNARNYRKTIRWV